jgi:hypothetical protein
LISLASLHLINTNISPHTDDEDKIREELKDLIDDNPIEEDESDAESDASRRKKHQKVY